MEDCIECKVESIDNECSDCNVNIPMHQCIDCINLCKTNNQMWNLYQCRVGVDIESEYKYIDVDNTCKMFSQEVKN